MKKGFFSVFVVVMSLIGLLSQSTYADCGQTYQQAKQKLSFVKSQALDGKSVDVNAEMEKFQQLVVKMQEGGCQSQMMQLMQYIHQEQEQYPAPPGMEIPKGASR